jgi:hypothetical protein
MSISRNQQGIAHLTGILVILVLLIVGVVGYRVVRANTDNQLSNNESSLSESSVPNSFKSTADVTRADKALEKTSVDDSLNPNQLDSDINALQ